MVDPDRANELLRYGIGVLRGQYIGATQKGRIHVALLVREELVEMGAWWQARTLNFWIHRAQGGEFRE